MFKVALFMGRAGLPENVQERIPDGWFCKLALGDRAVQFSQMPAIQIAKQISGGKFE